VIVLAAQAPAALQMPAAALSAESGAPILFVTATGVPPQTAAVLSSLHRPAIYVIAPAIVGAGTLAALARFGAVTQISYGSAAGGSHAGATGAGATGGGGSSQGSSGPGGAPGAGAPGEGASEVENAIAVARFSDGAFGWGVREPGHGLVFANATRPLDGPASALLSASGDYGPLLLLESSSVLPSALAHYLGDIQPAYGRSPQLQAVHGVYNHGWLIGDEHAISAVAQAEIDSLLEISPSQASSEEPSEPPGE
jgi:hypothetical protein